jgi:hypothetical protein
MPAGAAGRLNPWLSIWTMPRATMRQILDTDPRRMVIPLVLISGVVGAIGLLPALPQLGLGDLPGAGALFFAAALVCAPIFGLLCLYLLGWLFAVTGRWLEGTGDGVGMRAAMAWSNVPAIWGGLLLIPRFMMMESQPADLLHNPGSLFAETVLGMLQLTLGVWQIVILLKCIGEAHGFSAWRALGALIFSLLILGAALVVPVAALAALVAGGLR